MLVFVPVDAGGFKTMLQECGREARVPAADFQGSGFAALPSLNSECDWLCRLQLRQLSVAPEVKSVIAKTVPSLLPSAAMDFKISP